MSFYRIIVLLSALLWALLSSCEQRNSSGNSEQQNDINLEETGKRKVEIEEIQIKKYIKRRDWDVLETGTGLRIHFLNDTAADTRKPVKGNWVKVAHKMQLINGRVVYEASESDPAEFRVDMDEVESGIHEGIKYLSVGDSAVFIIPSALGHGVTGNQDRIPGDATLIVNIKLLSIR
ncbi:MAG TPA: hypothetical protein DDX92_12230 [Flavobacteriales bacterium]|jgi:FKBP-type peptidyl-prolyl cis-trans isomerase|nr:hypothetical protein [Flavobacteriales bacterium]